MNELQRCHSEVFRRISIISEGGALIRAFPNMVKLPPEPYVGVPIAGTIEAVTGDATELVGSEVGGYFGGIL